MDPMYGLMSMEEIPDEKQKALAQMLRGQSADGARLATSSIAPVQEQGRLMQTSANTNATNIGLQNYRKRAAATAEARAAADAEGSNGYKISPTERLAAKKEARNWREQVDFFDSWTDNKQTPVIGGLAAGAARWGLPTTEDAAEARNWWSNFKSWENAARNAMFGSALTATEKAAWDATSINENMQPDVVRHFMQLRRPIIEKKAAHAALQHMADGHNQDSLEAMYRNLVPLEALQSKRALNDYLTQKELEVEELASQAAEGGAGVEGLTDEDLMQQLQGG
jgi:hypothetical protein